MHIIDLPIVIVPETSYLVPVKFYTKNQIELNNNKLNIVEYHNVTVNVQYIICVGTKHYNCSNLRSLTVI